MMGGAACLLQGGVQQGKEIKPVGREGSKTVLYNATQRILY